MVNVVLPSGVGAIVELKPAVPAGNVVVGESIASACNKYINERPFRAGPLKARPVM